MKNHRVLCFKLQFVILGAELLPSLFLNIKFSLSEYQLVVVRRRRLAFLRLYKIQLQQAPHVVQSPVLKLIEVDDYDR